MNIKDYLINSVSLSFTQKSTMEKISCQVSQIEFLTDVVSKVTLTPSSPLNFKAGQYLHVIMGEKDKRPFSIANAPREDGTIELHIGAEPGNEYAGQVLAKMRDEKVVDIEGGLGDAYLNEVPSHPVILLAGGTGFSYTWAILQELLAEHTDTKVYLYWGTRQFKDMYAHDELLALERQHINFTFLPVIEAANPEWQGRSGIVHQAVLDDFVDLKHYQVFVAGRFDMAKTVKADFLAHGLKEENLFGDAYAFI
jgi:aquacobalamin reductase/NAD(P)H-flavin reductase